MSNDNAIAPAVVKAEVVAFDYETVEPEHRTMIESRTQAIKEQIRRTAQALVEIGNMLADVKERLPHGQFTLWLQIEFNWDIRTAQRFMSVANMFKNDTGVVFAKDLLEKISIDQSALYILAAKSTPQTIRQEILERAYQGESFTKSKVKQLVQERKVKPVIDFAIGDWVEVRQTGTWYGRQGPVAKIEKHEITVQIDNGRWKFLRFYREDLVKVLPFEQGSPTLESFYKPGDLLVIDCPKNVDCDYKRYNGCWAVVNAIGESGHLEVQLAGRKMFVMTSDVDPIDNPPEEIKQAASKINTLLALKELDEFDKEILQLYLRRCVFTNKQQQRLDQIWSDYFGDLQS